jgi:hypothetical protein
MNEQSPPLLPNWPGDCAPDRFLLRPVDFGDVETVGPRVQQTGTYVNRSAGAEPPQRFPLTAFAPAGADEPLVAYTSRLRVWLEAVPATDEVVRSLGEPSSEDGYEVDEDAITLEIGGLIDRPGPMVVFAILDPQTDHVGAGKRHNYWRPSDGLARIEVSWGDAQLEGVRNGPYRVYGGQATPQAWAGRRCSVFGWQSTTYTIGSAWRD